MLEEVRGGKYPTVPPKHEPREQQPPKHGTISGLDPAREDLRSGWLTGGGPKAHQEVKKSLAGAEAKMLASQEPQPRRVSWENKPRPRKIINLKVVGVGGAGRASTSSASA